MSIAGRKHYEMDPTSAGETHLACRNIFSEQKYIWSYYWNDTSAEILRHFTNSMWLSVARSATMLVNFQL